MPKLSPFIGFFQDSDGSGYAYSVLANDADHAELLIGREARAELDEDAGDVMVYDPAQLRMLAEMLEDPTHEFDVQEGLPDA
ncbi:MAG: hypothetical protein WC314_20850 [Vulcanimicrobiota bacterium]